MVVYTPPTATDVVDGNVAVSCSPASGAVVPIDTTKVTCAAIDAHGNRCAVMFSVTVVDTVPPALGLPGPVAMEATGPGGASVLYQASAVDAVDGLPPGPW